MNNRDIQQYSMDDAVSFSKYQKIRIFNLLKVKVFL